MKRVIAAVLCAFAGQLMVSWAPSAEALPLPGVVGVSATSACAGCSTGGQTPGGYSVQAQVHFTGDAAPGGGSTISTGVPATCWWSGFDQANAEFNTPSASSTDPSTWLAYYDWTQTAINGTFTPARVTYGERSVWEAAVARAQAGEKLQLFKASCRESAPECAVTTYVGGAAVKAPVGWGNCGLPVTFSFFPVGAPPVPTVDPADLALLARDHMVIPDPQIDRNPKVGTLGGATLVALPTWFWVTDPAAVGGSAGTRTIRAEVGAVWAQVAAKTGGLTVTSPSGGTTCSPSVAATPYRTGAPDASGCTVAFHAASVGYPGGYPVDATTTWEAAWTGSGSTSGQLAGLTRGSQVTVPVAESQAIVTGS